MEAKPHCGLMASLSIGMNLEASSTRRTSSSIGSRSGVLVVTKPSTTVVP